MSKKKRLRPLDIHAGGHGKKTALAQELRRAEALLEQGQPDEAIRLLESLIPRAPQLTEALPLLAAAYQETGDLARMALTLERYLAITPQAPEAPDMLLSIAGAYMIKQHPALAVRAFQRLLEGFPDHPEAAAAKATIETILPLLRQDLLASGLLTGDDLDFAARHEKAQVYLESGDASTARRLEEELLREKPAFLPAMNNISQTYVWDGDLTQAITVTHRALEIDPNNIHALANLLRYHVISGHCADALPLAARLQTLPSPLNDAWVKQVEALTFLQDDAGVWAAYQAAAKHGVTKGEFAHPLGLHLAAVAAWHLGHERKARALWKQALANDPSFMLAQNNLDDLAQPVAHRHGPWPFEINNWVNPRTLRDLRARVELLARSHPDDSERAERALRAFAQSHPDFVAMIPTLLVCGDPSGRMLAVRIAAGLASPECYEALRTFVFSQHGPDTLRIETLGTLTNAGVIPSGPVRMWVNGAWTEMMTLGYVITDEPEEVDSDEVSELNMQAIEALHANDGVTAETALRAAIALMPDNPRLLHNLSFALATQDRQAEALALLNANFAQHPDYLFARLGVAMQALQQDQLAEAEELIKPLLTRTRFHVSEFEAFAEVQVRLAIKKEQPEAAESWLAMWEQALPNSPKLQHLQTTVDMLVMSSRLNSLMRRKRKPKVKD